MVSPRLLSLEFRLLGRRPRPGPALPRACRSGPRLPSSDKRHFRRHNRHELDIGVKRQAGHVDDRIGDVIGIHPRLARNGSIGLGNAGDHSRRHVGCGVADVDLATGDIERPAIERDGAGQAGNAVLGGRIGGGAGARNMGGYRAVIDDAAALRVLFAHQIEGAAGRQENAGQVDVDDGFPLRQAQIADGHRRHGRAGIVEDDIEPAETLLRLGKEPVHGIGIGDVAGYRLGPAGADAGFRNRFFEFPFAAASEDDAVASAQKCQRRLSADTGTGARHHCDFAF